MAKILVVEDNEDMLDMISTSLQYEHFAVELCQDAAMRRRCLLLAATILQSSIGTCRPAAESKSVLNSGSKRGEVRLLLC